LRWFNNFGSVFSTMLSKSNLVFLFILILMTSNFAFSAVPKRYTVECDDKLLDYSNQIMISQLGVVEKSNKNDGEVAKYLTLFGLGEGYAYCAAAQYYCFYQAAKTIGFDEDKIPVFKSALALKMFAETRKKAIFEEKLTELKKHDLIFWRRRNTPFGHTERVVEVVSKMKVITIGFNVKPDKQSTQNQGVHLKKRIFKHPIGNLSLYGAIGFKSV